jgi:cobaltochelatase CobS
MTTPIDGTSLVRCNERSVRKPCKFCGRSEGLYWAHDMDRPGNKFCQRCKGPRSFVMIEADGTKHECRSGASDQSPEDHDQASEPKPASPPAAFGGVSGTDNQARQVADLFGQIVTLMAPKVDESQVRAMIDGKLGDFSADMIETVGGLVSDKLAKLTMPLTVNVVKPERPDITIKNVHKVLPLVLTDVAAGEHVMMVGPAGTGKSTIAEQAAEALGRPFFSISLSPQTPASQLLGYMNATGDYVRSLFREAFELGGVFHFDEFDNGNPSILALINAALANGQMAFPDGMVKRHADFNAIASANTYGRGPDRKYVGRQAIDLATLDRFTVEHVDVDESLEQTLCLATGLDTAKVDKILAYVRTLRGNADSHKLPVVFSPRASVGMCRLIHAGRSVSDAIDVRVKRGMSEQDWSKVTTGAIAPRF